MNKCVGPLSNLKDTKGTGKPFATQVAVRYRGLSGRVVGGEGLEPPALSV